MRLARSLLRLSACGAAALPLLAPAEEGDLDARIRRLETELAAVRLAVDRRRAGDGGAMTGVSNVLEGLEIHGAISQGFAWCDANHKYLTLDTDRGTFAWTDMTLTITKDEIAVHLDTVEARPYEVERVDGDSVFIVLDDLGDLQHSEIRLVGPDRIEIYEEGSFALGATRK